MATADFRQVATMEVVRKCRSPSIGEAGQTRLVRESQEAVEKPVFGGGLALAATALRGRANGLPTENFTSM